MAMTDTPDDDVEKRNVDWYAKEDPEVPDTTREILENYSGISPDQVLPHVKEIRDKAWQIHPYPCIGTYRFLSLAISHHPLYTSHLLPRLRTPDTLFLDLGTALGQDIRRLAYDGVPSSQMYGSDLRLSFMQLGYDLFLDKDKCAATFLEADVFDSGAEAWRTLEGRVDVLQASAFFHLFDLEEQREVARRVVKLLKGPGAVIVGQQVGNVQAAKFAHRTNKGKFMFRHNEDSWREFWAEVGKETGTEWDVQVELREAHEAIARARRLPVGDGRQNWEGIRWLLFTVTRTK